MTDPDTTDIVMALEDEHEVICFKKVWLERGLPNICLCESCKNEAHGESVPQEGTASQENCPVSGKDVEPANHGPSYPSRRGGEPCEDS